MSNRRPRFGLGLPERVVIAGVAAGICLLLGFCAGGAAFSMHGLGYFAAFPFWLLAALCGALGLVWGIGGLRRVERGDLPPQKKGSIAVGLGCSGIVLVIGSGLALVLMALIGLGLFVAVGMLLSHPL